MTSTREAVNSFPVSLFRSVQKTANYYSEQDDHGRTVLHRAALSMSHGGNVSRRKRNALRSMTLACPPFALLLQDREGETFLHVCARRTNMTIDRNSRIVNVMFANLVHIVVSKCPEALSIPNIDGNTPLHIAVVAATGPRASLREDDVRAMVDKYPKAQELQNRSGNTPLHIAIQFSWPGVGAVSTPGALKMRNGSGDTPAHIAITKGFRTYEMLAKMGVHKCPSSLETQDANGNTPLHLAVSQNERDLYGRVHLEEVGFLMAECPAAMATTNNDGNTPLHNATQQFRFYHVPDMIDAYPDALKIRNNRGETPLDCFCRSQMSDLKRALCSKSSPDETSLLSLRKQRLGSAEILRRASFFLKTSKKETASECDQSNGHDWKILHACLGLQGCSPPLIWLSMTIHPEQIHLSDHEGNLPIHLAAANRVIGGQTLRPVIEVLLKQYPTSVCALNAEGRFPLHLALESGKRWDGGVSAILKVAPELVVERDVASGLFPFMIAACGAGACVTTIYNLLRLSPEIKRFASS